MSKLINSSIYIIRTTLVLSAAVLIFSITLNLFFNGSEALTDLSTQAVLFAYLKNIAIVLIALAIVTPLNNINFCKQTSQFNKPSLSIFTEIIITFPGLPLLGLLLSMFVVRITELLNLQVITSSTITAFTLTFWIYGIYKCNTVYFKTNT